MFPVLPGSLLTLQPLCIQAGILTKLPTLAFFPDKDYRLKQKIQLPWKRGSKEAGAAIPPWKNLEL